MAKEQNSQKSGKKKNRPTYHVVHSVQLENSSKKAQRKIV